MYRFWAACQPPRLGTRKGRSDRIATELPARELEDATPDGYLSLNDECRPTNTNVNGPKPYDHIMFNTTHTGEIDREFDFQVVDLIEAMRGWWDASLGSYPGDPYDHNRFRRYYSDHHPVVFRITSTEDND